MNFKTQRFQTGHPLYSETNLTNADSLKGFTGTDKSTFGQFVDEEGEIVDYTLERRSTLIPEGIYDYSLYYSPDNKMIVILLHNVPGHGFIEHHPANWWYQLKGCTAHGASVDVRVPMLDNSKIPFQAIIKKLTDAYPDAIPSKLVDGKLIYGTVLGQITYETLKLNA